jgi:hypothetical protein
MVNMGQRHAGNGSQGQGKVMSEHEQNAAGKLTYETPILVKIGSFEDITQGANGLITIDGTYPANTPVHNHTS